MKAARPGRGGRRAGAGVKCADGAVVTTLIQARVDDAAFALIMELGDGVMSVGVRRVCAELLRVRGIMKADGLAPGQRAPTRAPLMYRGKPIT